MVKKDSRKKTTTTITIVICILVGLLIFAASVYMAERNLEKVGQQANEAGLEYAKKKCKTSGIEKAVCATIRLQTDAVKSECYDKTCWIVYVSADDLEQFQASMVIETQDNKFKIKDFTDNES